MTAVWRYGREVTRQDTETRLEDRCCVESLHGLFVDDRLARVTRQETSSKRKSSVIRS